jgi:tRNA-Thr(GGU) m(6)t(6)A37 methyltransferase TsaA
MSAIQITPIGIVHNSFSEPVNHHEIKSQQSIIIVDEKYSEALLNIENCEFIDVVYYFHKSETGTLSGKIHSGETRGAFASRSPRRPNLIGITTVKLIRKEENKLYVSGLDAINNTPVIDIKCCDTSILEMENGRNEVHDSILKSEPRLEINNLIAKNDQEQLMLKAGQLHGHFCPGLAMGVMAATFAMNEMKVKSDGMEDLLAITETNNCFSDGIQFVTGCSFGNNSLIYKDLGKTAFTLTTRDGKGIRICSKHESQELIKNKFPEFHEYYQKVVAEQDHRPGNIAKFKKASLHRAFETLQLDFEALFTVQLVQSEIPTYAKIHESVICGVCGESVMKPRTREKGNNHLCYTCDGIETFILDGNGISKTRP